MALHIVAFDYLEGLATAGLVNDQALAVMRDATCGNTVNGWKARRYPCGAMASR